LGAFGAFAALAGFGGFEGFEGLAGVSSWAGFDGFATASGALFPGGDGWLPEPDPGPIAVVEPFERLPFVEPRPVPCPGRAEAAAGRGVAPSGARASVARGAIGIARPADVAGANAAPGGLPCAIPAPPAIVTEPCAGGAIEEVPSCTCVSDTSAVIDTNATTAPPMRAPEAPPPNR